MTNPAQLKYLDAMGIPVWVSRDLVIKAKTIKLEAVDVDPVDSILHDLDVQPDVVAPPVVSKQPNYQQTQTTVISESEKQASEIGRTSLHTLYACGSLQADWMVIGESPEINSDRQNQPYAGDSGVLLSNMLRAVGIENPLEDAYLVNVLKSSQKITPEMLQQSSAKLNKLLLEKIAQIKPKMLLVVGQIAAQNLLQSKEPLARLRAKEHQLPDTKIPLVVTYYPSYLLSKPLDKRKAWEDLKLAMRLLD